MDHLLEKLKNSDFSFFEQLSVVERCYIIKLISSLPNQKEMFRKLLPFLMMHNIWTGIANQIFSQIYLQPEFEKYAEFLLTEGYVESETLTIAQIEYLASQEWGILYLLSHKEILNSSFYIIEKILKYPGMDYPFLVEVFSDCSPYTRLVFLYYSVLNDKPLKEEELFRLLKNYPKDNQRANSTMWMQYSLPKWFLDEEKMKPILGKYFEIFFDIEQEQKLYMLNSLQEIAPSVLLEKYQDFLNIYRCKPEIDAFLTTLILMHQEDKLTPYLTDDITYLNCGSTTYAFRIKNKVLKLTEQKYCNNCVGNLFLLAPTETIEVVDEKLSIHLMIEIQDYLPKVKNGRKVSKEEIIRFLAELEKQGYNTDDPNNLKLNAENFGFLKDYHDANITGFSSYEELPKWFKERPLVLYDIDKVYKKKLCCLEGHDGFHTEI